MTPFVFLRPNAATYYLAFSDVKNGPEMYELFPVFRELFPLFPEKGGIGGRIAEIGEVP